jgi:ferritin-like metal-binding protein YciE
MATPAENLMHWLRDAHAMEKQAIESVERQQNRLEHYPELRNWAHDHVQTAQQHRQLIRQCIERRGGSPSTLKDVAMTVMGNIQELSGTLMADEVLKNAIGDYSFKHYQIACYKALIAAAEEAGDPETKRVCEGILSTDQELADRLLPYIPEVTREYMRRDAADVAAKR